MDKPMNRINEVAKKYIKQVRLVENLVNAFVL